MTPRQRAIVRGTKAGVIRFPTGATRLDLLLEGGLRRGDTGLLHGPAFLGKGVLAIGAVRKALDDGRPAIVVTTRREAARIHEAIGPDAAKGGMVQIVDVIAASIGCDDDLPGVTVVDGPTDLNGIAAALNDARAKLQGHHEDHLLVIDSLSTLIALNGIDAVFRFLQVVLGSSRRAGAHSLLVVDETMHEAAQVEALKHLCGGTIQVRDREGKQQVRLLGFDLQDHLGWIDYRVDDDGFDVIGSFAAGRIR